MHVVVTRDTNADGGVEVSASLTLAGTEYGVCSLISTTELKFSHDQRALIQWHEEHLASLLAQQVAGMVKAATKQAFKEKH